MAKVQFTKGVPIPLGKATSSVDRKRYASKCGRFRIESRLCSIPTTSMVYRLFVLQDQEWRRVKGDGCDSLAEAKDLAQDIAELFAACTGQPNDKTAEALRKLGLFYWGRFRMCKCGHSFPDHRPGTCTSRSVLHSSSRCDCAAFVGVPSCECGEVRLDDPECPSCERPTDGTPTQECGACAGYGILRDDDRTQSYSCSYCRGKGWVLV
jgi:hypothetical protein